MIVFTLKSTKNTIFRRKTLVMGKDMGLGVLLLNNKNRNIPTRRNYAPKNTPPRNRNFPPLPIHLERLK